MKFTFLANIVFEADHIDHAMVKISEHFENLVEESNSYFDYVGSMEIKPVEVIEDDL